MNKNVEKLLDVFKKNPYYLEMGAKKIATRLKVNVEDVYIAKAEVKIQKNKALYDHCKEVGVDPDSVVSLWHKSGGISMNIKPDAIKSLPDKYKEDLLALKEELAVNWDLKPLKISKTGNLLMPNIFDLHLGKLAWGEETGEDYDFEIAKKRFNLAIEDLIGKASGYSISKILFPVGNDIFNSDRATPFSQTTQGTPQMDDTRWQKLFREGHILITNAIQRLAKVAPVEVFMVFGNHDYERTYYLGEVLAAVFDKHPNVNINNGPKARKYYKWGCCLLGLTHGDKERTSELPLIMAQEAKEDWANTWYREWFLGHLHHKQKFITQESKDYRGVRVTFLTSPSASDAWHYSKAFTGAIKGAEGFIFNDKEGLIGTVIHNIQ